MKIARFDSTPTCGQTVYMDGPDQRPSGFNQVYTRRSVMPYGRQLRGFDGSDNAATSPYQHDSWAGGDLVTVQAGIDDDTVGNGIFDGPGAPPVQHAGNGVFEARYSEPGYLYRERGGLPSEVLDQTTGLPLIYHPGSGGSWHEDVLRTYRKWDVETPRYYSGPPYQGARGLGSLGAVDTAQLGKYAVSGLLIGVAAGLAYKLFFKKG